MPSITSKRLGIFCIFFLVVGSVSFLAIKEKSFARKSKLKVEELAALNSFIKEIKSIKPKSYQNFERCSWDIYSKFIKLMVSSVLQDPFYVSKGYKEGVISKPAIDNFLSLLQGAKTTPISHDDYDPNYFTHPNLRPYESDLNKSHKLFVLEDRHLKALDPILEELKEPIAACLGSSWRIINVVCWETFANAIETGPNEWHTDGLPLAINKIMIYLTGAGEEVGTTALRLEDGTLHQAEGPPGTWLLFKISEIMHKGIRPKQGSRIALEIRAVPALDFDLRPYCAGFNAHYPKQPWYQPHLKSISEDSLR